MSKLIIKSMIARKQSKIKRIKDAIKQADKATAKALREQQETLADQVGNIKQFMKEAPE